MNIAFCIGNGESRRNYDLTPLQAYGVTYGANAVYRDCAVDHLVCCDRRMAIETVQQKYTGRVYTRQDWYSFFPYDNFSVLPELPWQEDEKWTQSFHMGSGLHAVNIATQNSADIVVLIGHDFWGNGNLHNNIYKGTANYADQVHHAVDPSFWIKQFVMFFNLYPNTQFVFCQPNIDRWRKPTGWEVFDNVQFQELGELQHALDLTQG